VNFPDEEGDVAAAAAAGEGEGERHEGGGGAAAAVMAAAGEAAADEQDAAEMLPELGVWGSAMDVDVDQPEEGQAAAAKVD
jgi:hypothetical protein